MPRPTKSTQVLPLLLVALLASCDTTNAPPTGVGTGIEPQAGDLAPLLVVEGAIPNRYVIVLKDAAAAGAGVSMSQSVASTHGAHIHFTYRSALNGFAATLSPQALEALRRNPLVALVAPDVPVRGSIDQASPPWGLDRIDQRARPINSLYRYTKTGVGVRVYIIDTGIRPTHTEFASATVGGPQRATIGADFIGDGQAGQDCHGHGTHVAGTIAGTTYGVAKGAAVIAVRVLDCNNSGFASGGIAGIDWVTANAVKPAVANMSVVAGFYPPLNTAVQNSIAAGIPYVLAAGNDNKDACLISPASTTGAITVGASTAVDARASFSNWGSCVDIFAPGTDILSSWFTSDVATATLNGTSMAAPHVTGVAALFLEGSIAPYPSPAAVVNAILTGATMNRLTDLSLGSPNVLLYSPLTASTTAFSVNPSALSFTFLIIPPAAAVVSAAEQTAKVPSFTASSAGLVKTGQSGVKTTLYASATSLIGSATFALKNVRTGLREWEASAGSTIASPSVSPANGVIAGGGSTLLTATVNPAALGIGTFATSIRVTDLSLPTIAATTVPITVTVNRSTALVSGVPKTGLAGSGGSFAFYTITVPAGAPSLKVTTSGGSGDVDLYVRYNLVPTFSAFDCRPFAVGNNEACIANFPVAGNYYVMLHGATAYAGVTLSAATEAVPPAAPTNVGTTFFTSTVANVTWTDASSNETSFRLQRRIRNPDLSFSAWTLITSPAANAISFLNTGLAAATSYQYRLRACNAAGCSTAANGPIVTTPATVGSPVAPATISASVASSTQINVSWANSSTNETRFELQRRVRDIDGVTWAAWAAFPSLAADATAYSDAAAVAARTSQYMVRACNVIGCSLFKVSAAVTTPAAPGSPVAPTTIVATAVSPTQILLTWVDASSNETSFSVQRRLRKLDGVTWGTWSGSSVQPANTTLFASTSLTPGATYQYAIRACNAAGCSITRLSLATTTPE